jgi:hypothetical protein
MSCRRKQGLHRHQTTSDNLTHYNIFSSPLFAAATLAFLDKQMS